MRKLSAPGAFWMHPGHINIRKIMRLRTACRNLPTMIYSIEHELSQLGNNDAVGRVLYTSSNIAAHNKRGIKHADE